MTDTNTENEETTLVTETSTGNEETTQVTDTSTGNGLETTESGRNATDSEHGTAENSKWENNDGTTSHNGILINLISYLLYSYCHNNVVIL